MLYPSIIYKQVIIVFLLLVLSVSYAYDKGQAELARDFVTKCLSDQNVFVANPPADRNPYKELSSEEVQQLQKNAFNNGAVLFLYLSGLPVKFESFKNYSQSGLQKSWYKNGNVKSEEIYDEDKLISGIYFDVAGNVVGQVENGTGMKIIYGETINETNAEICGAVEYVDGLKHGIEINYWDYEQRLKGSEAHYIQGELHGVSRSWMSTGQLNSEEHFKNGLHDGSSISWYQNGQIKSIFEYIEGQRVGAMTWFYENGVKKEEFSKESQKRWYPSGALMFQKTLSEQEQIISGVSFDSMGHQNGSVTEGVGSLVIYDDSYGLGRHQLIICIKRRPPCPIGLPSLGKSSAYGGDTVDLRLSFQDPDNYAWTLGTVTLNLPEGCHSERSLQFEMDELKSGRLDKWGAIKITLPCPVDKWTGVIIADIQGKVKGYDVRYQQPVFEHKAKEDTLSQSSGVSKSTSVPKPRIPVSLTWRRPPPQIDNEHIPEHSQAIAYWAIGDTWWLLYKSPALLLVSTDDRKTWEIARSGFSYRPCGLYMYSAESFLLWGTKPAQDVNEGVDYVVEESQDNGETWKPYSIPEVDYLLSIGGTGARNVLLVTGVRIPSDGIPVGKHWFELPKTFFLSQDGKIFTEIVGQSLLDIEQVQKKSIAPNGRSIAFLSIFAWQETSYYLYWVDAFDDVPSKVCSLWTNGELVWSANSRILAINHNGTYVAYLDALTGESKKKDFMDNRTHTEKEKAEITAFHEVVEDLMATNGI